MREPACRSRELPSAPRAVPHGQDRAARAEQRFALPVTVAALASVPATFLTVVDGTAAAVGHAVNHLSLAVLVAETVVLWVLAGDRLAWLRRHKFVVAVALLSVPAVLLATGPVQVLRLARFVRVLGALRIVRVGRILRAGRVLQRRAGLRGPAARLAAGGATVLAAAFVALVLADPTSTSRELLAGTVGRWGLPAVLLAGMLLGGATFVVLRRRSARGAAEPSQFADGSSGTVRNTPP